MKWILFLLLAITGFTAGAQTADTVKPELPPYLKTRQVPSFKILLMDSATFFYKYQLKKNTTTVVIWFNPDCEHCQTETKNLTEAMSQFADVQFVFASYAPFGEMKQFYETYGLAAYSNIKMGRDLNYFIPSFYKVRYTPFVAVYNKDGNLNKVFEGGAKIETLLAACKE